jgi:hypothetical protein
MYLYMYMATMYITFCNSPSYLRREGIQTDLGGAVKH